MQEIFDLFIADFLTPLYEAQPFLFYLALLFLAVFGVILLRVFFGLIAMGYKKLLKK